MSPAEDIPLELDPQRLQEVLSVVREQVSTALWLSAGMVCAVGMIALVAAGCRRGALAAGLLYAVSLCFVHNGHAQILGPVGCAIALTGLFWPRRR